MEPSGMARLIIEILARHTGLKPDAITPDLLVAEDLGLDSLDAVELLMIIEQETGRRFELDDAAEIRTVGSLVERIVAAVPGDA